jgi:hypothetical protein
MTRNMRLVAWGSAAFAIALAIIVGPLFAGFAVAGASLAFIAVLMGMRVGRAIGDWRLGHPWKFGRRPTHSTPAEHDERRAA